MNKSTIAAIAAASLIGFGAAGTAVAEVEVSGYTDIRYNVQEDDDSPNVTATGTGEAGNFSATGELDFVASGDGATVRIDLDILNVLDPNPQADTTLDFILDVEQLNISFGVPGAEDMVSLTAGIFNSPFGLEGQDSPDIPFANNGLLWSAVASNLVGIMATVSPAEGTSINLGYVHDRDDATGGVLGERANEFVITANVDVAEGIGVGLGYFAEEEDVTGSNGGDQIDLYVTADLGTIDVAVEYLAADPDTGTGAFDSGYGVSVGTDLGMATANLRYEFAEAEGAVAPETTALSLAVGYDLAANTNVRLDYTNSVTEVGPVSTSADDIVIQFVTTF